MLINVKMPVGILTSMSKKNSILGLSEVEKNTEFLDIHVFKPMIIYNFVKLSMKKSSIPSEHGNKNERKIYIQTKTTIL